MGLRMPNIQMPSASDAGGVLGAAFPAQLAANFGSAYINTRFQGEANDRAEANAWDMYQTERRDQASAHQREVADLKAAGLNPILSTHGQGSGTASGSPAAITAPKIEMPDFMAYGISLKQLEQMDQKIAIDKANSAAIIAKNLSEQDLNKMRKILMQKGMIRAEMEGEAASIVRKFIRFLKGETLTPNKNFNKEQFLSDPNLNLDMEY